ncbi:FTR1 family iron permease [Vibrio quintilis]|nr:FTR1 family protein [Vibrio quintilis]
MFISPLKHLFSMPLSIALLIFISFSASAAIVDYQAAADDINTRLDKTLSLYQAGDVAQAKSTVQMAYFDIYEGIEGPIRINYSQKYSAELEAKFGEIRKMIADKAPVNKVQAEIEWLKKEIATVPEILKSGHQLVAENQDLSADNILPFWRTQVEMIDSTLNQALTEYRESAETPEQSTQKITRSRELILTAQYTAYKNSDLETAIRLYRSAEKAAGYNDQFKALVKLTKQDYSQKRLIEFSYSLSNLVADLKDDLPGLPATRDSQKPQTDTDTAQTQQDWQPVIADISSAVEQAIAQYQQGQVSEAMAGIQDAYFDHFEASGMENSVGARDTNAKSTLEGYFTRMVSQMKAGADVAEIQSQFSQLKTALNRAAGTLAEGGDGWWAMLIASLTIILREGLEALLIVAAIAAYLVKNEHQDKIYIVKSSVIWGLIASLITAVLFQWLFTNAGASRELLEGFTMLIAVVVLFFMSYWLLSKVEATQWKHYLESKLSHSLTAGSLAGLWFASFLAVYREGAETILFYYALAAGATPSSMAGLFAGLFAGIVILVLIYFVMRYSVVRLPLKPFFMFTGSFMYLMAFVFSGKGVLELVEGKLFQPTLLSGWPQFSLLGIYPYAETLAPQAILIGAAIAALIVIKRQRIS